MRGRRREKGEKKKKSYTFVSMASSAATVVIPTGIVALDHMVGGGIPRGKFVEIYGPYKGGKTFLALEFARAFLDAGGEALWFDCERALDDFVPARIGIDTERCEVDPDPPDTVEEFTERTEAWLAKRDASVPGIVGLDSVAVLSTKHELETPMEKRSMDRAGLIYKCFRRLAGPLSRTGTTLAFVNQVREKIGVFFGSPETTTGGKGPEFFSSVRLRVSRGTLVKDKKLAYRDASGRQVGIYTVIRVEKNRLMPEGQLSEFLLKYDSGFDPVAGSLRLLANNGLIKSDGDAFSHRGRPVKDEAAFVDAHPDMFRGIWRRYRGGLQSPPELVAPAAEAEAEA